MTPRFAGGPRPIRGTAREVPVAIILAFAFGTVMLDRMIQLFLSADLIEAFALSRTQLGLLAGVVSLNWAASTAVFGIVSDRIGRKKVLVPAMIAFSLASFLSGFARSFGELLAIRALLGFCEGPCWAVIMAMMSDASSPAHRGRNLGIVNCAGSLAGSAIAPLFATQVAAHLGWRAAFMAAGLPGLVVGGLIAFLVIEPPRQSREPQFKAGDLPALLGNPGLWLCFAGAACFTTFVISLSLFAPLYLSTAGGISARAAGLVLGASGVGGFVYSLFGPAVSDRVGVRRVLLAAAALCALLPLVLILGAGRWPNEGLVAAAFLLTAAPAIAALLLVLLPVSLAPRWAAASAIGFVTIGAEGVGATLGPLLTGALADRFGFVAAMIACSAAAALIAIIALAIRIPTILKREEGEQ